MKTTKSTLLAAAMILGAAATSATAQTTGPVHRAFGTGELPDFLKTYDLNEDGVLSVEERLAYEKARREAKPPGPGVRNPWDTDGDGKLSDAEKQAARDAIAKKIKDERSKRFAELDVNTDGFLTASELAAIPHITPQQVAAMIQHLDKNDDHQIDLEEFLAAMRPVEPPFPPMPPPPPGPCPVPPILKPLDTNNDGIITPLEFSALDTNHDGRVSPDEWKAYLLAHPELLPPTPPGPPAP